MIDLAITNFNKCKVELMMSAKSVFLNTILFSMKHIWEPDIPTADVDGITIRVNPTWFNAMSDKARIGLLVHECWHVAFNHPSRSESFINKRKLNQAQDYLINLMLKDVDYELPAGGLVDEKFRGMSSDQIYDLLPDDHEPDYVEDVIIPGDEQEQEVKDNIQQILIKAHIQAKEENQVGDIPGEIQIMINNLINPKLDALTIFRNYYNSFCKDDYSMSRPNMRFFPDYYLPSLYSEGMDELAFAVDTSCSVSDPEFIAFISEIDNFKNQLNPKITTVIDFDTVIRKVHILHEGQDVRSLNFSGRGGTDLRPVFDYYDDHKPNVLVVFSDLECCPIEEDPGYPVVWICVDNPYAKVNFGTLIHYHVEK